MSHKPAKPAKRGRKRVLKKDKFVENFCLGAMKPEEAARAAGFSERFIATKLQSLLEDHEVTEKMTRLLSKDGLQDPKATRLVYKTVYDSLHAESAPRISAREAESRARLIEKILDKPDMSDEMRKMAIEAVEKSFSGAVPNNQSRLWAANTLLSVKGDNAPLKVEHSATDPLAGKSEEEQKRLVREADKTLKLIQGGKGA